MQNRREQMTKNRTISTKDLVSPNASPAGGQDDSSPVDFYAKRYLALCAKLNEISEHSREACREWPDGQLDRCNQPAVFILWGKLFPPEALGPRCEDHAAQYTRTDLHTIEQSAIFDLRPLRVRDVSECRPTKTTSEVSR